MRDILTLPWLLPAGEDFRETARDLRRSAEVDPRTLTALASRALDLSQLATLNRLVERNRDVLAASSPRPVRLAVAASHTAHFLADALVGSCLRHGVLAHIHQAPFGQAAQQLFDPASELASARPDFVLVMLDPAALGLARPSLGSGEGVAAVDAALAQVEAFRRAVRDTIGAAAIFHTLPHPADALFGHFDARQPGSPRWMVSHFNARLADEVLDSGDLLLDLAAIAETVGLARWHDRQRWHDAKVPFALDAVPLVADHVARLLAAARGLSRKCLVLDLDNTLWGGIVGDDGVEGIAIGQGSAAGEAHLAVQDFAADLRRRGVVLAVCSKNEEAAALAPFREHEEMALREEDIAVFVANWTDKATNLRAIAESLNIGTDALVFLDDNPAERERVRQELPEVAVPEIGEEPADYAPLLAMAGYFEALSFGEEDRGRADMYRANAERASAQAAVGNLDDYLASLEMTCSIRPFDEVGRARIAQLTNKSNQFNLTTRRYSETDVAVIEADPNRFTVQVRLADRFGDNGMISVAIFDRAGDAWHCDTWLMSCRVLGRRVEEAVLAHVAGAARQAGARRLTAEYRPTPKNAMVAGLLERLGFTKTGELPDGGTAWSLDLEAFVAPELPMTIEPVQQTRSKAA